MIPRYTRPEMASIWEPQTRFKIWFEIEAHAADALAEIGTIPKEAAKTKVIYGGSVEPANIAELAKGGLVDGFLIGHASVEVKSFAALVQALS